MARFLPMCTLNLLIIINICITYLTIHTTLKSQLSFARLCKLVDYVVQGRILKTIKKKWNHGSGKREYPEDLSSSEMSKVKFSNFKLKSNDKNHNMKGILLVVTCHPLLKSLSAIITKNLSILHIDKEVNKRYLPGHPCFHFIVLAK